MADGYLSSLRSGARDARDSAEDYGRRAAGSLRDTGDRLRDTGGRLRDRGEDAKGDLARLWSSSRTWSTSGGPAATEASHAASRYAYQGRDLAMDYAGQLRDVTRARPLVAIGIAVAATWFISTMLRSKR